MKEAVHVRFLGFAEELPETGSKDRTLRRDRRQMYLHLRVHLAVGHLPLLHASQSPRNFVLQREKTRLDLLEPRLGIFVPHLFGKRAEVGLQFRACNVERSLLFLNTGIVTFGAVEASAHLLQCFARLAIILQPLFEVVLLRLQVRIGRLDRTARYLAEGFACVLVPFFRDFPGRNLEFLLVFLQTALQIFLVLKKRGARRFYSFDRLPRLPDALFGGCIFRQTRRSWVFP